MKFSGTVAPYQAVRTVNILAPAGRRRDGEHRPGARPTGRDLLGERCRSAPRAHTSPSFPGTRSTARTATTPTPARARASRSRSSREARTARSRVRARDRGGGDSDPAGAASELTSIGPPAPFAVYKGTVVWSGSRQLGLVPAPMRKGDGDVRRLPVRTRPIPFDVDIGPTSSGGILAVYSRCDIDQAWDEHQMPDYRSGKRCDIYKLDLATGKEERFTKINSSDGSEYWPSYWKGTVAFARAYESDSANPNLYSKVDLELRAVAEGEDRTARVALLDPAPHRALRLADRIRVGLARPERGHPPTRSAWTRSAAPARAGQRVGEAGRSRSGGRPSTTAASTGCARASARPAAARMRGVSSRRPTRDPPTQGGVLAGLRPGPRA